MKPPNHSTGSIAIAVCLTLTTTACTSFGTQHSGLTVRSQTPTSIETASYRPDAAGHHEPCCEPQIERGAPHRFVDGVGNVFGIPEKILLWDRRAENHDISPATEAAIQRYLTDRGLADVKVRLNQYAPGGEWRRLRENKQVGAGWRYTVGALSVLGYTVFPGRVFGGDAYNPFTNSIYLYSDIPSIAIHEGAYARDNATKRYKGTYGFLQSLDGINIWHETVATREALDYIAQNGSPKLQREANRVLHPNYGKAVGGSAGGFVEGLSAPLTLVGAATGHVTGRLQNRRLNRSQPQAVAAK